MALLDLSLESLRGLEHIHFRGVHVADRDREFSKQADLPTRQFGSFRWMFEPPWQLPATSSENIIYDYQAAE
jgi:hypothetical protein